MSPTSLNLDRKDPKSTHSEPNGTNKNRASSTTFNLFTSLFCLETVQLGVVSHPEVGYSCIIRNRSANLYRASSTPAQSVG